MDVNRITHHGYASTKFNTTEFHVNAMRTL